MTRALAAAGLWFTLLAGCNVPGEEGAGRCADYCRWRKEKGCSGEESVCRPICQAAYDLGKQEGKCSAAYEAQHGCYHSKEVVDLGCALSSAETAAACKSQVEALAACRKERDGK